MSGGSQPVKRFQCSKCGQVIEIPHGVPKPARCSKCGAPSAVIHRLNRGPPVGTRGQPWRRNQ